MHWNTLENENGAWEGPGRALAGMLFAVFAALDVEIEIAVFLSFVVVGFRLVPFFCQNFFFNFFLAIFCRVCVLFCFVLFLPRYLSFGRRPLGLLLVPKRQFV